MNAESKGGSAETLLRLLTERHSCRSFRSDPLPRDVVERIAEIAQRTASWCNSQPWMLHVVSGDALERARAALPAFVQAHAPNPDFAWPQEYRGVYQERRRESGFGLYAAVGIARGDREAADAQRLENFRFFGAPHVALVTTDRPLGVYGAIDCGAYVGTFMLAARAFGVATIAQAALAAYPDFWRERLRLGDDRRVVCGISFGHPDADHPANAFRTSRASLDQTLRWTE